MVTKRKKVEPERKDAIAIEAGRRLAQSRKAKGWTQAQLAEATGWRQSDADEGTAKGISPSAIGNYEQGSRRFDVEEAEIFGQVFELPSAYFMVVVDEHEAEIIIALRKRSPTPNNVRRRQPA